MHNRAHNAAIAQRAVTNESAVMGRWNVEITLRDCADGKRTGMLRSVNVFSRDGALVESGSRTAGAIAGRGYGTWRHEGGDRYSAVLRYYRFERDGSVAELQRITRSLRMSADGKRFSGTALLEIIDSGDRVLVARCATEVAERLKDGFLERNR